MIGQFKTFINNVLTLGHPPGPDTQHTVAPSVSVTVNGSASKMADLKPGDNLTTSGDPVTSVTATR